MRCDTVAGDIELAGIRAGQQPRQTGFVVIIARPRRWRCIRPGCTTTSESEASASISSTDTVLSVVYRGSSHSTVGASFTSVTVMVTVRHSRSPDGVGCRYRYCVRGGSSRGPVPPWSSADPSPWLMSNAIRVIGIPAVQQRVGQYVGITGCNASAKIRARTRVLGHFPGLRGLRVRP